MESQKEDGIAREADAMVVAAAAAVTLDSSPVQESPFHVNLQSRSYHLKRRKMVESSKLEQSVDARRDDPANSSQKYKEFVTQSENDSVGLNEEFTDSKDSLIPQSRSSSRIMDGFLADPVETDCANSTLLKGVRGDCPKSNSSFDCEGGATTGSGEEAIDMLLVSPEQANQEAGNLLICADHQRDLKIITLLNLPLQWNMKLP